MKIFISSLISGMEPIRAAAKAAVLSLGHEPVMAEDFPSQVASPQVACLSGIRQSALVVLILGERYGAPQGSGLSATHEEYEEAKTTRPVIAFVEEGISPEPRQADLLREVQGWDGGRFRGPGFRSAEQLRDLITRAIHHHEIANAARPLDEAEMLRNAIARLPGEDRGYQRMEHLLHVSIMPGPTQPLLRPSAIEDGALRQDLMQAALFGANAIFDTGSGTKAAVRGEALTLQQEQARVVLEPTGAVLLALPLPRPTGSFGGVIEEDVSEVLGKALRYTTWLWDRIDPTERLTHAAPVVSLSGSGHMLWRTRDEHARTGNSISYPMLDRAPGPISLTPPVRPRAALRYEAADLISDFVTLMRRAYKGSR